MTKREREIKKKMANVSMTLAIYEAIDDRLKTGDKTRPVISNSELIELGKKHKVDNFMLNVLKHKNEDK